MFNKKKKKPEPVVYEATGPVNDLYIAQVIKSNEPNNEQDNELTNGQSVPVSDNDSDELFC